MSTIQGRYALFVQKLGEALAAHDFQVDADRLGFSRSALAAAETGDWSPAASELRDFLHFALGEVLTDQHEFVEKPYVRRIEFPQGGAISIAIVNKQSAEWYGTERTLGGFDFLLEARRGVFDHCSSFLDLGGHHLVWACYYAMTSKSARVVSFEPSILNVVIGLFNCLVNDVIERVEVVPFAVLASNAPEGSGDEKKMLVDFMRVPLRARRLSESVQHRFDFIKTDIEGYEFELLDDPVFLELMRGTKQAHLELHLGHLVKRGVQLQDWLERLRAARIGGSELYSQTEMFEFLGTCDPKGFHAFMVEMN